MKDWLETYHSTVVVVYFTIIIGLAMFVMHPIVTSILLVGVAIYDIYINRMRGIKRVCSMIPVFLITSLINPLFSHRGVTLICYLPTGNPLTVESILFGLQTGMVIVTVLLWFSRLNEVLTGDRVIGLLARRMPAIAMIISFVLGFVPRCIRQVKKIRLAEKAMGEGKKNVVRSSIDTFMILTTWALENSVITAQSMRSRGYGATKRVGYTNRKIDKRDTITLIILLIVTIFILFNICCEEIGFVFYPYISLKEEHSNFISVAAVYVALIALALFPFLMNLREDVKWRRLRSKI